MASISSCFLCNAIIPHVKQQRYNHWVEPGNIKVWLLICLLAWNEEVVFALASQGVYACLMMYSIANSA
jgi:hypothetical protein